VYEDLPPVCHWLDLLMLAERLAPGTPLLPEEPGLRAEAIGLSALIVGVDGFGWHRRLQLLAPLMRMDNPPEGIVRMARKYGWTEAAAADATRRLRDISAELHQRLTAQQALGR